MFSLTQVGCMLSVCSYLPSLSSPSPSWLSTNSWASWRNASWTDRIQTHMTMNAFSQTYKTKPIIFFLFFFLFSRFVISGLLFQARHNAWDFLLYAYRICQNNEQFFIDSWFLNFWLIHILLCISIVVLFSNVLYSIEVYCIVFLVFNYIQFVIIKYSILTAATAISQSVFAEVKHISILLVFITVTLWNV